MPKSTPKKLAYQAAYNARPEEAEKGVARRRARRHDIAEGKVAIGDKKDVVHKVALANGGSTSDSNTKVGSIKANRGWRKGESGYKVPNVK
jgi:hypothetical protein